MVFSPLCHARVQGPLRMRHARVWHINLGILCEVFKYESVKSARVAPVVPPHVHFTVGAYRNAPAESGKPGKIHGGLADVETADGLGEATDPVDHSAGVSEGMKVASVYFYDAIGEGDDMSAENADYGLFLFFFSGGVRFNITQWNGPLFQGGFLHGEGYTGISGTRYAGGYVSHGDYAGVFSDHMVYRKVRKINPKGIRCGPYLLK